jgi:hypothetical protein
VFTARVRVHRERIVRTLTFSLRPAFVLRVLNRFQLIAGLTQRSRFTPPRLLLSLAEGESWR